jgi:hypothetical protein
MVRTLEKKISKNIQEMKRSRRERKERRMKR